MKNVVLALTACLSLVACAPVHPEAEAMPVDGTESSPVARCAAASTPSASRSVVRLKNADKSFHCTGVLFTQQRIATAAHCVAGINQAIAEIDGHDYIAQVVWAGGSDGEDVAVLELSSALTSAAPATLAAYSAEPREPLTVVGYGCSGGSAQFERPTYRRWSETAETTEYNGAGCTCPGDSGSPVFNARGELVAINWAAGTPGLVDAGLLL